MTVLWIYISLGQLPIIYAYSRDATVMDRQRNSCRYGTLLHYKTGHHRQATRPETEGNGNHCLKLIYKKEYVKMLKYICPVLRQCFIRACVHDLVGYFQMKLRF
jgi:hypothetical protein